MRGKGFRLWFQEPNGGRCGHQDKKSSGDAPMTRQSEAPAVRLAGANEIPTHSPTAACGGAGPTGGAYSTCVQQMTKSINRGSTTTRADLLEAVFAVCPMLSRAQARTIFEMTLEEVADCLDRNEPVKLRGFDAFNVRSKRERVGRNPKTGVEAAIKPRRVVTFKPSPVLIARLNGLTLADFEADD